MTRRLTFTMVAVVAGALLVTSLGTVFLLRLGVRSDTARDLRGEARRIAARLDSFQREGVLHALVQARALAGGAIVQVAPNGRVTPDLPAGIDPTDLSPSRLRNGGAQTGTKGSLVFAAAGAVRNDVLFVVVLTRQVDTRLPGGLWFLVAASATLAVAAAVAANLGRRLTRPIRDAQAATRRIAEGDLAARVPVIPGEADDELVALARSINSMAESLERSRGLERQFLLSVSHDLRTPLTSIRGYADALAEGRAPDPAQAAGVIQSEARRLERLVGDLLELARLDSRRFSLNVRATDVAEVVAEVAEGMRPAAEEAGVALSVDGSAQPTPRPASTDPDRLAQVVANLLENALKFARGAIALGVGAEGARVVLWVQDDGPGIAPADLARVFEPFYQSDRSSGRPVGTGLGLAIVHELVDAMGGSVEARTGADGGTRMEVRLPVWAG